jgi:hypothetical protein
MRAVLTKCLQWLDENREDRRNESAKEPHCQGHQQSAEDHDAIDGGTKDNGLPATTTTTDDADLFEVVEQKVADRNPDDAAEEGQDEAFEQEGGEDIQPLVTHQAKDTDVLGALADCGEHGVHHSEATTDGHDDRHEDDRPQQDLVDPIETIEVFRLGERVDGCLGVLLLDEVDHCTSFRLILRPQDERRVVFLVEQLADQRSLCPNFGIERGAGTLHDAGDDPRPIEQRELLARFQRRAGWTSVKSQLSGESLADDAFDRAETFLTLLAADAGFIPPRAAILKGHAVDGTGHAGVIDPAHLQESAIDLPFGRGGDRHVDQQVRFATDHRLAPFVAENRWQAFKVCRITGGKVAEPFVGGTLRKDNHVARLATGLRELFDSRDEREERCLQADHADEGCGGEQRGDPTDAKIEQVVLHRYAGEEHQDRDQRYESTTKDQHPKRRAEVCLINDLHGSIQFIQTRLMVKA